MKLNSKIFSFFSILAVGMFVVVTAISLYSFREFSIASSREHMRTAAEIVRAHLTDSMINGVIGKRENFLQRLTEVQGLQSARVVRGENVQSQFGAGLSREQPADEIEQLVLKDGKARYELTEEGMSVVYRGTIPFTATAHGTPNCLQCHKVSEGNVLGAVTLTMSISPLKQMALTTVALIVAALAFFSLIAYLFLRRLVRPLVGTADNVAYAVQRAVHGDFTVNIERKTNDEIGQIAEDLNRLMGFLQKGLHAIGSNVALLISQKPTKDRNLLTNTVDMVETLKNAAQFKKSIEEDETRHEIYQRLSNVIEDNFDVHHFSVYEVATNKSQIIPIVVDGAVGGECKWCDPQILVRPEACRARRTGHVIDAVESPGICYAFQPQKEFEGYSHVCLPVIQSGVVGSVVQIVVSPLETERVQDITPYISAYLREAAPVLETKRLMDTLRESTLQDAMTGLKNRRFLEEYVDTLVATAQRQKANISILMLDLDYFKMVNDTYGHDAGDTVLKSLAKVLKQSVRASDIVIRYGGEEFLILLQNSSGDAADMVAEKIRTAVEAMKIPVAGTTLQKTISIGIADFPNDSETFWQAVKYADVALYQAKETGRNRWLRFKRDMWSDEKEY
ncbi:diguanylate cyclase [Noviherbaspirillum sp. UKPF54]|uniref:sensor domain-containing diguanylate cyclase n=1 Tax=Noviherbaspirillum sp. UKPF54 TaxID=2601898 RepID=UPI0011B104EC|nr:diguanylate cyclase [Noviherbaspirillum sp. UKPF54]QDZ27998.1 diguanylate cyclase [Noviherbaspirillum sp. UKPF54]